jgi:Putative zinc-finger
MSGEHQRFRELAPELALGIADGEERAWALEHLAGCPACRTHLERLSSTADELTLLAPAAEPPAGFEGRVTGELAPPPRRPRWTQRLTIPALAAAAAAAVAALAVWVALDDDRDLADAYRDTLAVADGEYIDAAPLDAPGGEEVGYIYGCQGRASWVIAVVYDGVDSGRYQVELVTHEGEQMPLRELSIENEEGSVGAVTPVPYDDIAEVRLLDERGREVADSKLRE